MRLLELVAGGYTNTNALFHLRSLTQRRVFDSWRIGFLLEGLAHGPEPMIAGLDDEIRAIPRERHYERDDAYKRSRLTITDFGRAVLFYKEDFSRHNPIDRWWGGTHLTNDSLWRYDRVLIPPKRQ